MDELDIRELRYFVAVAEELHFGRAAARLAIAQPALSKAVQRIESRLRVRLFDRTSRNVALTPAGAALLEHGRHALNAMTIAVQNAQRAAGDEPLRFVIKPGGDANLLPGILAAYSEHPHARQVEILFSGPTDGSRSISITIASGIARLTSRRNFRPWGTMTVTSYAAARRVFALSDASTAF